MKYIYIIFIVTSILFQNCGISVIGLYSDYEKLSEIDKEKIVFLNENDGICEIKKDEKIYAITGSQLLDCIETKENVLVYIWTPYCTQPTCYPLSHVQKYCASNGLILYVIANYYDSERIFSEQESIDLPLFSMNERYYKRKLRHSYSKKFINDLLKNEKDRKKIIWNGSFIFCNGKLVDSKINMEDENTGVLREIEFQFNN